MNNPSKGLEAENRPLTRHECEVILWLLEHHEDGEFDIPKLQSQIGALSVAARCNCGCPTIYFAFNEVLVQRKGERIVSDYLGTVDGQQVGVMLFQSGGQLSSLEAYSTAGTDKPFGLPQIETLYSYEELSKRQASTPPPK